MADDIYVSIFPIAQETKLLAVVVKPSTVDKSKSCIYTNNGSYLPVYVASRTEIISRQTKVLQLQEYRDLSIYMSIAML